MQREEDEVARHCKPLSIFIRTRGVNTAVGEQRTQTNDATVRVKVKRPLSTVYRMMESIISSMLNGCQHMRCAVKVGQTYP